MRAVGETVIRTGFRPVGALLAHLEAQARRQSLGWKPGLSLSFQSSPGFTPSFEPRGEKARAASLGPARPRARSNHGLADRLSSASGVPSGMERFSIAAIPRAGEPDSHYTPLTPRLP